MTDLQPGTPHPSPTERFDVAVAGGGIVGLATALALVGRGAGSVVVLEAEAQLAAHQSSHNSGVIHSGLYYTPGSFKARLCRAGRDAMFSFCEEDGVRFERTGKLVLATTQEEATLLEGIAARGRENGLESIEWLSPEGIKEHEPHAEGVAAIFVPQTGIADFPGVCRAYASRLERAGVSVRTSAAVVGAETRGEGVVVETRSGAVACGRFVACAGIQADRLARACGLEPGLSMVPFRGEYVEMVPERRHLVRNLIYPVPDPRFPFLGTHFTRTVDGAIEAGPNAVLAFSRNGYRRRDVSWRDLGAIARDPGFRRFARKNVGTGLREFARSLSTRAVATALARMVPEVRPEDLRPGRSGVRAQAMLPDGTLVDDFRFVETDRMLHVLNAPSPAATASLAIGEEIADRLLARSLRHGSGSVA